MKLEFYKYQGTGNDFIIIDNRVEKLNRADISIIKQLCDRRFGIGADGLILLQNLRGYDFEMVYFNADGNESTMCGNGGRCIVAFAKFLGVITEHTSFLAIDGSHEGIVRSNGWVELKMGDVSEVEKSETDYILNTGSPHFIQFVEDVEAVDVYETGRSIRYNDRFKAEGINVNFVEETATGISVATYERGVEDETYSCGTGVTAAAIAHFCKNQTVKKLPIQTKGGNLEVRFESNDKNFSNIWLCGPATQVFKGEVEIA